MSQGSLQSAMMPVVRRVRAYFAPVERERESGAVFDPSRQAGFGLDCPPAPWVDLGWIDNFERTSQTMTQTLRAGAQGETASRFRGLPQARVEFDFRQWGKLQMALAAGREQMNVLASASNADEQPSGGSAIAAVAVLAGSTANEVICGAGAVDTFAVGDLVAVDSDYGQQTGFVGTGIAAAYVNDPADVRRDVDYVRRVTFNVGRVAEKTATSLLLAQPLLGGAAQAGMGVQKVMAFLDRDGGAFFQEWSGLFVLEAESGGRVCFHYPRLSSGGGQESSSDIRKPLTMLALHGVFDALPAQDDNDGRTVVCYRSYVPAPQAAVY